jgi:hypothetical protein
MKRALFAPSSFAVSLAGFRDNQTEETERVNSCAPVWRSILRRDAVEQVTNS